MKIRSQLTLGIALLSLGLGILGSKNMSELKFIATKNIELLGYTFIVIGSLLIITFLIISIYSTSSLFKKKIATKIATYFDYEFEIFQPVDGDLIQIDNFVKEIVGKSRRSNIEIFRKFYYANPKSYYCIRTDKTKKIVGFYFLIPLTKEANKLIQNGIIVDGRLIKQEHICNTYDQAYALYIGNLAAKSNHSKAFILFLLKKQIGEILTKNNKIEAIYARPGTKDGLRLLTKYGFNKMMPESVIWKLSR